MPRNSEQFHGTHFSDPFKELLNGHAQRVSTTKDAMQLFHEVHNYRQNLFPPRSVPVSGRPGSSTLDSNFFRVSVAGSPALSRDLNGHFTDTRGYPAHGVSYDGAHDLSEFFENSLYHLLIDGIATYVIDWERIKVANRYYTIPVGLRYINPSTITIPKNGVVKQKFSWIAKEVNNHFEYQDSRFSIKDLVIFKHPIYPFSPVGRSLRLLKQLNQWSIFSLQQGQANVEPENHSIELERTRYKLAEPYRNREAIARAKVRRIFNQIISDTGVEATPYYEVLAFAQYKMRLNEFRDYFMKQFSEQILKQIQERNGLKNPPQIEYRGFAKNDDILSSLKEFEERKVNVEEFLKKVKDDFDRDLYQ